MLNATESIKYIKLKKIKAVFDFRTFLVDVSFIASLESSIQSRQTFRQAETVNIPKIESDIGPKKVIKKSWLPMFNERRTFATERERHPQKATMTEKEVVIDAFIYCFEVLSLIIIACIDKHTRMTVNKSTNTQQVVTTLLFLRHWSPRNIITALHKHFPV